MVVLVAVWNLVVSVMQYTHVPHQFDSRYRGKHQKVASGESCMSIRHIDFHVHTF